MAKNKKAQSTLKFIGGVNKDRIGGNCSVIEHTDSKGNEDVVMFDLGSIFTPYETGFVAAIPNVDEYFDRVDLKTGELIKATKPVKALFITHVHEDHIGALMNYVRMGYKLPPIKTSGFSRNFIRLAFKTEGLHEPVIEKIKDGDVIKISDNMEVKAVDVSHSIVDALGFQTKTYDNGKPFAAFMNNGDFLTEEEMPIGKSFNKANYIENLKSADMPITVMCIDSTSTSPNSSERIGFEQAVENTLNAIKQNPDRNIIISPVISRSPNNISIDIEVARRLGAKVCLDGKWLVLVKDALQLSGYKDWDDVIYKGKLKGFLADKQQKKKYIVNTGAFAQGMENYEFNIGIDDISPIPMASATKMALDLHPDLRIDDKVFVVARQRIIDEINGKTGPKMLQLFAAQGAKVVMSPSSQPVGNFEQIKMQDSGHANAGAIRDLMIDVKDNVNNVVVIPIHGNPDQCNDTKGIMDSIGVETYLVGNREGIHIEDGKISSIEERVTPITWYAVRAISPNPFSERDIPLEGLKEFWEVTEDYQEIRKICEVANTQRFSSAKREHSNIDKLLEMADGLPRTEKMVPANSKRRTKKKEVEYADIVKAKKSKRR